MLRVNLYLFGIALIFFISCTNKTERTDYTAFDLDYPEVRMDTAVVEKYHDTLIADTFRWLEDDRSEETAAWVDRQNDLTYEYLERIPYRDQIEKRLEELWNFERYTVPEKAGDYYYFFKNDGLQNQDVLYRVKSLDDSAELVLDPNSFSEDGSNALGEYGFSSDGKYLAYQLSESGSDWRTAYVLDLESLTLLDDKVEWIKFSTLDWAGDGFYYSRYPVTRETDKLSSSNRYHKVYYHRLGTSQEEDQLIYDEPDYPERNIYSYVTSDEEYLVLYPVASTSGNALKWVKRDSEGNIASIVDDFDHDFQVIDYVNGQFYVLTNDKASNQRVIRINPEKPQEEHWFELIPETGDVIRTAHIFGNRIFLNTLHEAKGLIKAYEINGDFLMDMEMPGMGEVVNLSGEKNSSTAFYSFKTFTTPLTIYSFDTNTLESEVFKKPEVKFKSEDYTTRQEWYESYDGTRIPMFITHHKDLQKTGDAPTLLYGYGGFNIPYLPDYDVRRLPLLENGGIYVVANIRGGGEFGSDWHRAGTLENKQNVFDDFQAAAEYLIQQDYTSKEKLAIEGRSNGGLLIGACITQRPDLYQVAFPIVGVLDMLRYHQFTIGWAWATDYGRSDDPEAFEYLIKYSPLHNVEEAEYPATLVTTADHDDRVVPAHSFKFISELQRKQIGDNPVLIRVDKSTGHKHGKPLSKRINEAADMLSFMFYNLKEPVSFELKN